MTEEVATAICLLEKEFPPSFFDPMSHLPVHLVEELHLCGPVQNRWMYPLEWYMKYMKLYVWNKARLEGCMATGIAMEVVLGLLTEYILECESTSKRVWDTDAEPGDIGEVTCSAYKKRTLSTEECQWAHSHVLQNSACLDGLREACFRAFDGEFTSVCPPSCQLEGHLTFKESIQDKGGVCSILLN